MQAHSLSSPAARNPLATDAFSAECAPPTGQQTHLSLPLDHDAALAHDARNLLGALGLYSDLLARPGVLRPEHVHYATELRLLSQRSHRLMNQLIVSAAPALSAHTPRRSSATKPLAGPNPAAILSEPAVALREIAPLLSAIAAPSAEVYIEAPRSLPCADIPKEAFERILVNLVRNAAQAIASDSTRSAQGPGCIRVILAIVAGHLRLSVEDDGPGMPLAVAAAFLAPSPLPPGARSGFGHRIVHELASSTGGTLALRVRPGRGTVVRVRWPLPALAASKPKGVPTC